MANSIESAPSPHPDPEPTPESSEGAQETLAGGADGTEEITVDELIETPSEPKKDPSELTVDELIQPDPGEPIQAESARPDQLIQRKSVGDTEPILAEAVEPEQAIQAELAEPEQASEAEETTTARQPEKIFGQEVIRSDDVKAASREVSGLIKEGTPPSLFQAARELAHLKRANVIIGENRQEEVFSALRSQREAVQKYGGAAYARYLTYLKYLGVEKDISEADKSFIAGTIADRAAKGGVKNLKSQDLFQVCMNAKYLGVDVNPNELQSHLELEFERVNKPGNEDKAALRLAQAEYLGFSSEKLMEAKAKLLQGPSGTLGKEGQGPVDAKLAEFRSKGMWGKFAWLKGIVNRLRGKHGVDEATQKELVNNAAAVREKGQKSGIRIQFSIYIGLLSGLSVAAEKNSEKSTPKRTSGWTPTSLNGPDGEKITRYVWKKNPGKKPSQS